MRYDQYIITIVCTLILILKIINRLPFPRKIQHNKTKQEFIQITYVDFCIGIYLFWGLCCLIIHSTVPLWSSHHSTLLWKWLTVSVIYALIRSIGRKMCVFRFIAILGILQAIAAIGQQIGILESNHRLFPITGLIGNPGQLGGFQAVTFLSTLLLLVTKSVPREKRNSIGTISYISILGTLLLIIYSLYLADSRAALIAVIIGSIVLYQKSLFQIFNKCKWIYLPAILLTIGIASALYGYRSESVNARLLIWRVSCNMIAQKPLLGYGTGSFNDHYMLCQAQYFEQHPNSNLALVADNVAYPYNEFLHVLIEQGIIGLLLLVTLIIVTIITATKKDHLAPLISLLVFSCFSYPADVFWLLILFPLLFACIESKTLYIIPLQSCNLITIPVLLLIGTLSFREIQFYQEVNKNVQILSCKYDKTAAKYLSNYFDKLSHIRFFNTQFIIWMTHYPEILDIQKFRHIMPNCENWCNIGDYYASQKNFDKAEKYYHMASQMIPTRLKPNYLLWQLYLEKGDSLTAKQIANYVLHQPLKVENTFTLRAKAIIKEYYLIQ